MYVRRVLTSSDIRSFAEDAHRRSSNIVQFSRYFSVKLHSNTVRDNGRLYPDHLKEVAGKTSDIIVSPRYKRSAEAAGHMHDSHEDIPGVVILDPRKFSFYFNEQPLQLPEEHAGKLIINQELEKFGEEGEHTSFVIYMVTREKHNRTKFDYVFNIINAFDNAGGDELKIPPKVMHELVTVSLIVKTADLNSNTDPDEAYFGNHDLREARNANQKGTAAMIDFLVEHGVADGFFERGKFVGFDESLFLQLMEAQFEEKKLRYAIENVGMYLPKIEKRLLITPGLEGGVFNLQKARDNGLYDYDKMRELLTSLYANSVRILDTLQFPSGSSIHIATKLGTAKGVGYQNYEPISEEIKAQLYSH